MIKKTYMLIRITKWEGGTHMMNSVSQLTIHEAMKWLQKEVEDNPDDKVFMVDEDMYCIIPKKED